MLARGEGERIVGQYMRQSPGLHIEYHDVASATGLTPTQVNNVLGDMTRKGNMGIFRVKAGTYVYQPSTVKNPEPEPSRSGPELFEKVGVTKDGSIVVRDEKGMLWRLSTEL